MRTNTVVLMIEYINASKYYHNDKHVHINHSGGPAGSMKGGRQIEVAKEILSAKNVPYIVAAPLLIQSTSFR